MTDPRETEATGSDATIVFRDQKFTIPVEFVDYPLSFIEAAEDGKSLAIQARELFGPKQWAAVRAMNLKGRDLQPLYDAINEAMGVERGESEASSD